MFLNIDTHTKERNFRLNKDKIKKLEIESFSHFFFFMEYRNKRRTIFFASSAPGKWPTCRIWVGGESQGERKKGETIL